MLLQGCIQKYVTDTAHRDYPESTVGVQTNLAAINKRTVRGEKIRWPEPERQQTRLEAKRVRVWSNKALVPSHWRWQHTSYSSKIYSNSLRHLIFTQQYDSNK